jgi:transposase
MENFGFARANICEEFTFEKHLKIISSKKIKVMEIYPNKDYSEMIQRYKTLKLD